MTQDREKIDNGPNARPISENIPRTAPGVPDDALAPGEPLTEPPTEEQVRRARQNLGVECGEVDTLPLAGE